MRRSQGRTVLSQAATLLLPLSLAGSLFSIPSASLAQITPAQAVLHAARLARREAVHQAHLAMLSPQVPPAVLAAKQYAQHQARLAKLQAHALKVQARHEAQMLAAQTRHQAHLQKALARQQARLAAHQASLTLAGQKSGLKYAKLHQQHVALVSGNVVEAAYAFRGTRYVMGGTSRSGFDCSGFVRYILSNAGGVEMPRTAVEQYYHGTPVANADLQAGDLVFFRNTYKRGISHVGLYAGNGQFIHAANAHKGVRMDYLNEPYYVAHYAGARRVLPAQMRAAAFLDQTP